MKKEQAEQAATLLKDLEDWEGKRKNFFLNASTYLHDRSVTVYTADTNSGYIVLPTGQYVFLNPDELRVALESVKTMINVRIGMLRNDLSRL